MTLELRDRIVNVFAEVYRNQTGKETIPTLNDETVLLTTGLDSLGFAILIAMLEQELGYDPFVLSDNPYYPRTFGELVRFYGAHAPL